MKYWNNPSFVTAFILIVFGLLTRSGISAELVSPERQSASAQWFEHGRQRYVNKDYDGAIAAFTQASKWDPNNDRALTGLSYCHQVKGNAALAEDLRLKAEAIKAERAMAELSVPVPETTAPDPVEGSGDPSAPRGAPSSAISPMQAVLRSAILPGWGQMRAGHPTRAWVVGGSTVALFAGGWGSYFVGEGAAKQYLDLPQGTSQERFDQAFGQWETWATVNHSLVGLFGGMYIYNLIDAYLAARPMGNTGNAGLRVAPWIAGDGRSGLQLAHAF